MMSITESILNKTPKTATAPMKTKKIRSPATAELPEDGPLQTLIAANTTASDNRLKIITAVKEFMLEPPCHC
jgi:hypothetical protein